MTFASSRSLWHTATLPSGTVEMQRVSDVCLREEHCWWCPRPHRAITWEHKKGNKDENFPICFFLFLWRKWSDSGVMLLMPISQQPAWRCYFPYHSRLPHNVLVGKGVWPDPWLLNSQQDVSCYLNTAVQHLSHPTSPEEMKVKLLVRSKQTLTYLCFLPPPSLY